MLQQSGLADSIGQQHIYLSIEEGIHGFQEDSSSESNEEEA
jgi:hypothetical protein